LWDKAGSAAELDDLDLPGDLAERLRAFNAAYAEDRLPMKGGGDSGYIEEGKRLLSETRARCPADFASSSWSRGGVNHLRNASGRCPATVGHPRCRYLSIFPT
jgi:hypothetical protein